MNFLFYLTWVLFLFVCLFLMLLVLIQKGRGGGLASAFGGAGGNTAFGSKTGDVLTWATSIVFGIFLLLGIALNLLANARHNAAVAAAGGGTPVVTEPAKPGPGPQTVPPPTGVPPAVSGDTAPVEPKAPEAGSTGVAPPPTTQPNP